jgi:hypothetical protein
MVVRPRVHRQRPAMCRRRVQLPGRRVDPRQHPPDRQRVRRLRDVERRAGGQVRNLAGPTSAARTRPRCRAMTREPRQLPDVVHQPVRSEWGRGVRLPVRRLRQWLALGEHMAAERQRERSAGAIDRRGRLGARLARRQNNREQRQRGNHLERRWLDADQELFGRRGDQPYDEFR